MLGLDYNHVLAPTVGAPDIAPPPSGALRAEPVPAAQKQQPLPVVKILLPVVMVVALGAVMVLMALSGRAVSPMMLIFPLMMLFGLAGMVNPQEKQGDIDETRRVYLRHLDALATTARTNAAKQRTHAATLYPAPGELVAAVPVERVWERAGAPTVRLGTGAGALCTPVDVDDPGSPEDLDPVCAVSLRRTVAAVSTVPGMPVLVQLDAFDAITLAGPAAADVARSIVCQLAFFYGPEQVSIDAPFAWAKWLPHSRSAAAFRITLVDGHRSATPTDADVVVAVHDDPDFFVDPDAFHLVCGETLEAVTAQGAETLGAPDAFSDAEAEFIARHLGFYRRPETTGEAGGDFLSMLGVVDVDALDAHTMWPGVRNKLTVPIGATPDGDPVYLDLKEAALGGMGPHGLCIGATGSGKSELLRTLVVALAVTHSPEELNFVLVDFKGGATFLGCEQLPHTAAVITNLEDEAVLVERMFDAISGEMQRRQELLRAAGNFANITDYTKAGHTLASLVIVVDEFTELLTQHPHFADLFVAVGRLGRSLGVHLLLASQRLEEGKLRGLDSHLSYRIGLKTFSAGESRQVLGVPDAYELPGEPGSGYLKAGMDLVRFRAAYVSGPLTRTVYAHQDQQHVRLFTGDEVEPAPASYVEEDRSTTLLDAVVDKAREVAQVRGMRAHQVWLPPLPERIPLSQTDGALGLIDEPFKQRQTPFHLDLSAAGGHVAIAGGPQTGKTIAVRGIVATQLGAGYAVYVIGDVPELELLPHVAGVASMKDTERTRRVIDEVASLLDAPRPAILVVDGWHALDEDLRDLLARIASEGPDAGIHLVVTTQRWSAIRPNVRDLIGTRIELRLTEPMDSLIDRKQQEKLPAIAGRGLTPDGKTVQLAFTSGEDIAHLAAHTDQAPVERLRVLPEAVATHTLVDGQRIPLGIGGPALEPVYSAGHVLVIGAGGCGKSTFIASTIAAVEHMGRAAARMVIFDPRRAHLGRADEDMVAAYAASSSSIVEAAKSLAVTLSSRLPGADVTPQQLRERSWWHGPELYLIIDDYELVGEEPLRPLAEFLPHARDIGLHVVATRKFGGVSRALFGPFLTALKDQHPDVLIMDGTRDEGALFGVRPTGQQPGRATWVHGEPRGTIQLPEAS
ncbi:type VII secretion protein EccCb [Corynebacterium fournieri]|uniref:type VII secretion protein EccCb n=2 Tax=Corynebacterium fournieri TaxID=1852390 RepID=UPI0025B5968E|nr:type VII secretion protein EccCb [Corynebacterium fournieri]WJY96823.1 ESX-1 secretion system protein EccCa1 [Corynebacterium fournieri]